MSLSRWTDNTENNMNSIINNMLNYEEWHVPEKDPVNNEELGFTITKLFAENKSIALNGNDISYNLLEYEYERLRRGEESNEMRANRIHTLSGFIIVYSDGITTQYITNRSGNQYTKSILRKVNNYSGQLEIVHSPFHIMEDVFTWMIYKVLNGSEVSLEEDAHLLIKKIIGFKGATQDRLAEVAGTGNRILNQLSTLAFLFENERVSYIKPQVEYQRETIEFSIDLKGNIDVDLETYTGNFIMNEYYERLSQVLLMTFLEIVPKILSNYHLDIENEEWSEQVKIDFFTEIGESISDQINKKMKL